MGSTRLPGKSLMMIEDKPLLGHVVDRARASTFIDEIVVATTNLKLDDPIQAYCQQIGIVCFRGSELNVLDRFYRCAQQAQAEVIVRITADDPFKDPEIIDEMLRIFLSEDYDYVSNTIDPTFPLGLDVEIFSYAALERAWNEAQSFYEHEHVTPYFYNNSRFFRLKNYKHVIDLSALRFTIDTVPDLEFTQEIYRRLYHKKSVFLLGDIMNVIEQEPHLIMINESKMVKEC